YVCLVLSESYIEKHCAHIKNNANAIEQRLDDSDFTKELAIEENTMYLQRCKENGCNYVLIDEQYDIDEIYKSII
ncbi:MAG: adenylate kinase, partial [Clostridia bacterium]|nr:adenylate kinase [Clostridia bacterium]